MIFYLKYNLFIILFFVSNLLFAQQISITGKVIDAATKKVLPYVNIQLKNTGIGTISNKNGRFYLKIPQKYSKQFINFSYIGYKTKKLKANEIKQNTIVYLQTEDLRIGEIIVMPDSTLLTLLKKAYEKIPENYPVTPTKLKGFYREVITIPLKKKYLYFTEAVIETYKTDYKNSSDEGQVKIIKSLVNEFPELDSLHSRFYGGVFDANNGDIVKLRYRFINPKFFKNYRYSLYQITKYQGRDVYVIYFDTQNDSLKGTRKGKFYIDKATLAYLSFEYESTPRGLKKYNKKNIGINSTRYTNKAAYVFFKGKWHYKYSVAERYFYENKRYYLITSEYLTTGIYTDTVMPIPYTERINYLDLFLEKAKNYHSDEYWKEYNILKKDSFSETKLCELYDTTKSRAVLSQKTKYPKKNLFLNMLKRLSMLYGLNYYPINTERAIYSINYDNTIDFTETLDEISYNLGLLLGLNYKINYRLEYNITMNSSFGNTFKTENYETGISYNMLINKKTKPLILKIGLLYSYNKFIRYFSTYLNNTEFEFDGKTIDAEKLKFGTGNTTHNIKAQISLEYKLQGRTWLYFGAAYYFPFKTNEKLFLQEESGSIFSRKNASIKLNNSKLHFNYNGENSIESHVVFNNYSLSLGLLFKF
jgi:hypothetical protein